MRRGGIVCGQCGVGTLRACLLYLFSTFFILQLNGQEVRERHDEVVVTANSVPVPFKNLSRTVRVLGRAEIEALPARSVADLLRYFPSVDVNSRGTHGIQSDLSIRGSGFEQVLVLINGIRLNDPQTGHHNLDLPVSLSDIERIEILYGSGSSLYGSDAVAGTVNIITRSYDSTQKGRFVLGQHNLISGSLSLNVPNSEFLGTFSVWGDGASGFEFDREFRNLGFNFTGEPSSGTQLGFYFLDKAFGANNFYGPSPSKEWTSTLLASLQQELYTSPRWRVSTQVSYRTHRDHFRWDVKQPGFAENLHRTHSLNGQWKLHWKASEERQLTTGAEVGGDWIDSSNLGHNDYQRLSAFFELEQKLLGSVTVYPALRFDRYSHFDQAWSPAISSSWWIHKSLKLKGSAGRSFRTPTFTELYYRDPNHRASSALEPETAVGVEAGLEWYVSPAIFFSGTIFRRREKNAIDWVREGPNERWESRNIRKVISRGTELDFGYLFPEGGAVQVHYTHLVSNAGFVPFESKYVLDYPRHSFAVSGHLSLPLRITLGGRLDYRYRVDGRNYWLLAAKALKEVHDLRLFLEASNLLGARYEEIRNVNMPGRWIQGGLEFDLHWGK